MKPSPERPVNQSLRIDVPCDWEALHAVRESLEALLERHDAAPKAAFMALLVLEEVGTNIIKYAYPDTTPSSGAGDAPWAFSLEVVLDGDVLRLLFEDAGAPFDPTREAELERKSLEESSVGGRGLMLVQRMSRGMSYRREEGRNLLEVTIGLAGE